MRHSARRSSIVGAAEDRPLTFVNKREPTRRAGAAAAQNLRVILLVPTLRTVRHHAQPGIAGVATRTAKCAGSTLCALAVCGVVALSPGISSAGAGSSPADTVTLHVVSHGWHSGVVIPAHLVDATAWPARRDFPDADRFEVGWGHRDYYQASDPDLWAGLRALFWPSPGVLHVVALKGPPTVQFPGSRVAAIDVPRDGAERLVAAIAASHEHDREGRPIAFGPSLYGQGRFYASVERFHLFRTCNAWVASRLRDAGVPMRPALALTTGLLFAQLPERAQRQPGTDRPLPARPASAPAASASALGN